MFKKRERLSTAEFNHYFSVGRRHHSTHLTIITAPSPTRKIAVVVGKKVAKRAVLRNRLRRRVYAELRTGLPADFVGVCIVLLKPSFATLPRKTAQAAVQEVIATLRKSA